MPFRIQYDAEQRFGTVEVSGDVTWTDIREILEALFSAPEWQVGSSVLWLTEGITSLILDEDDIEPIRTTMCGLIEKRLGGRSAVVTGSEDTAIVALLIQRLSPATGREMGIFATVDDALEYLGHTVDPESTTVLVESR